MLDVLIVDDSAVMRAMVHKALQLSGLSLGAVYQAKHGAEGLERLREHPVDLVLVDINMPVMSGVEMIAEARANPATARIPIIVVSSDSSETRVAELAEQGIGFIRKPFDPATLRATVRRALEALV